MAARSDGYDLAARARHASTSFSDTPSNTPDGSASTCTAYSLVDLAPSSVSNPTCPGSARNNASTPSPVLFAIDLRTVPARPHLTAPTPQRKTTPRTSTGRTKGTRSARPGGWPDPF